MTENASIRVLVADDHGVMLDGISTMLNAQPDIEVVAQARTGREAVELSSETKPDLAILDISMPQMNGIEATRQICARSATMRVLCLSMHADRRFVTAALEAGASGYLLKDCGFKELLTAVRAVAGGQGYLCTTAAEALVDDYRSVLAERQKKEPSLTPREREVLAMIADGLSTAGIAEELRLSIKTVSAHRDNISRKLGVRGVAALTRYAIQHRISTIEPIEPIEPSETSETSETP